MIYNCVEPGRVAKVPGSSWWFKTHRQHGHGVMFRYVDSCLGIICALADDSIFTCHINCIIEGDFNYQRALDSMKDLLIHDQVLSAVVFGDLSNWVPNVEAMPEWTNQITFFSSSCDAVDAFVDADSGAFKLMRYQAGRGDNDHSNTLVGADINLYEIAGSNPQVFC